MKRLVVALSLLAGFVLFAGRAEAHPLGNFTVNQYSGLRVHAKSVDVHYVLDDHLTARGHELIADALIAAIR